MFLVFGVADEKTGTCFCYNLLHLVCMKISFPILVRLIMNAKKHDHCRGIVSPKSWARILFQAGMLQAFFPYFRPVGYVHAQPRGWTRDYWKQTQLMVRGGPELRISRFQIRSLNHLAMLPPCQFWINLNSLKDISWIKMFSPIMMIFMLVFITFFSTFLIVANILFIYY